jgi:hypothetical protein
MTKISITKFLVRKELKKMTRPICTNVNIFLPYGLSLILKLRV